MEETMRKHYIDNLRWSIILLLIPFHAAQAFKTWTEPNYIEFGPNKMISSIIVFFGPFVMQLLFLFAGMSMRYALKKRSYAAFAVERIKRLLVPLVFGVLVLVPPMTYMADRFHNGYSGSLIEHYGKFFTVFTDMSGADGGFSFGQFWFLLYLFILSFVLLGVIVLLKKIRSTTSPNREIPFWVVIFLGLPLPIFSELLSVGGKSLASYTYIFLVGYYVFADDRVIEKAEKYRCITLTVGLAANALNVYLFIWSGRDMQAANNIAKFTAMWAMLLALMGLGKKHLDLSSSVSAYMSGRSFAFFAFHYIWLVIFQYAFADILAGSTALLFIVPSACAYIASFACGEVCVRLPLLSFLMGCKAVTTKQAVRHDA